MEGGLSEGVDTKGRKAYSTCTTCTLAQDRGGCPSGSRAAGSATCTCTCTTTCTTRVSAVGVAAAATNHKIGPHVLYRMRAKETGPVRRSHRVCVNPRANRGRFLGFSARERNIGIGPPTFGSHPSEGRWTPQSPLLAAVIGGPGHFPGDLGERPFYSWKVRGRLGATMYFADQTGYRWTRSER